MAQKGGIHGLGFSFLAKSQPVLRETSCSASSSTIDGVVLAKLVDFGLNLIWGAHNREECELKGSPPIREA